MILERIRQLYPTLTKSQVRLADHVVSSYHDVAFMTASELANEVRVNEATVIRFAQRLGYGGYPEFVEDVRNIVMQDLTASSASPTGKTRAGIFADALIQQSFLLRRVASQVQPESLEQACGMVQAAKQVLIVAQGAAYEHASLLAIHLSAIGKHVSAPVIDSPALFAGLARADSDLLVLCLSSTQDCAIVARIVDVAKTRGARTLCISLSPLAVCARLSEVALTCTLSELDAATADGVFGSMISAFVACLRRCMDEAEAGTGSLDELMRGGLQGK